MARLIGTLSSSRRSVPNAPTSVSATDVGTSRAYNNGAATVSFTAPSYDGGLPITSYTVTSSPGGFTASGASSPLTVTGLQSNTAYTFTVTASNAAGTSAASAASNSITATTVPQAPTIGTATDGGTGSTVSVTFTAGATGGKAVSVYTATSSPGSITGTNSASPITVSGLTSGTAYTFTVTATNANGTSTASAASNSVTPQVPGDWDLIATQTANGNDFIFSGLSSSYNTFVLMFYGVASSAGTSYQALRLNGVTSTSYKYGSNRIQRDSSTTTAANADTVINSDTMRMANAISDSPSWSQWFITNAQDTSGRKNVYGRGGQWRRTELSDSFDTLCFISGALTTSNSAITEIRLINDFSSTSNLVKLYGVK